MVAEWIIRESLTGRVNNKKPVDMEEVYRQREAGRTFREISAGMKVSEPTLRRRRREYEAAKAAGRIPERKDGDR